MNGTVDKARISALMTLYQEMRDPKYKTSFGTVSASRIEWVGRGPKDRHMTPIGLGGLLFDKGINLTELSEDESLLGALQYCCKVIKRYTHKGGIYIKQLDDSYHALDDYFQIVSQSIGRFSKAEIIGFHLKDGNGDGLRTLWESHPKSHDEIILRLAFNVSAGYSMPKLAREFLFDCLIGERALPKTAAKNLIGQKSNPAIPHRDYLLFGLAKTIRARSDFSVGVNQTKLQIGSPIPLCGASIVIAAMNSFGVTLNPRTGILLANKKSPSFELDTLANEVLSMFVWSERQPLDPDESLSAGDFSENISKCLMWLSCTI